MNAFEEIVAGLLRQEGYWTYVGYKVNLTKLERRDLGKPSLPRPEIDVLAYQAKDNVILWVECKSYLDSRGVRAIDLVDQHAKWASRYKVFTCEKYQQIVSNRLKVQLVEAHLCPSIPAVEYCLVAGKIVSDSDRDTLRSYFGCKRWTLHDADWLREGLTKLSKVGYEDDVAVMVAKLFGVGR